MSRAFPSLGPTRKVAAAAVGFLGLVALLAHRALPASSAPAPRGFRGDAGWLDPTDYPARRGGPAPPVDLKAILEPPPAALARARDAYARLCAPCHGPGGRGEGPGGRGLQPPPRDFTKGDGWKYGTGRLAILRALEQGVPGTGMASFRHLGRLERAALAQVVLEMGAFPRVPEAPAEVERSLLAPSGPVPNRIPVSMAMARLCAEARPPAPLTAPAWALEASAKAAITAQAQPAAAGAPFMRTVSVQVQENGFAPRVLLLGPSGRRTLMEALR